MTFLFNLCLFVTMVQAFYYGLTEPDVCLNSTHLDAVVTVKERKGENFQ